MDNASEALQLAGWVLIFILALSLSMNAFSQARQAIDQVLISSDRDYITTYIDGGSGKTHRIVGAETIVPTIYRAYRENFKIRIMYDESCVWQDSDKIALYQIETLKSDGVNKEPKFVYEIDLENQNLSDEVMKEYFIERVLFGKNAYDASLESKLTSNIISEMRYSSIPFDPSGKKDFFNSDGGFYGYIISKASEGKKIYAREELGVYFQEEVNGTHIESTANKTEKRVVTYYLSYK